MDTISDFKTRFNLALSRRNMKPVEVSEITGISKSTISHYMSGYTKPKTDKLYILAKALDVNEAWLIGYNIPMDRDEEDQNILRYDAELNHALNVIENSGYSWNYSMDPDCDILIKDGSNNIISCVHEYEIVSIYEYIQKKEEVTAESLITHLKQFFLSNTEKEHIEKYRDLDDFGKEAVDAVLNKELKRVEKIRNQQQQIIDQQNQIDQLKQSIVTEIVHRIAIPLYGKFASAGGSAYLFDDIPTDMIEVEDTPTARKADFVIGVDGDSMEPDFYDGDKVFVKKTTDLNIGDIGIFLKGSDCYLKELGEDRLISHNKDYKDIYANEEIRRIGKVIGKVED